jgi:hypothetical protein
MIVGYATLKLELQSADHSALNAARYGTWREFCRALRYCQRIEQTLREMG